MTAFLISNLAETSLELQSVSLDGAPFKKSSFRIKRSKLCKCFFLNCYIHRKMLVIKLDGLVKSPTSALCCISQSFNVRKVRLMITKFATPFYPAYVWRGSLNFLRNRLNLTFYEFLKFRGFAPIGKTAPVK